MQGNYAEVRKPKIGGNKPQSQKITALNLFMQGVVVIEATAPPGAISCP